MDKTSFGEEVYSVVASIPPGRVLTYGQIAYLIGKPQCSRMVGQAMHNAPEGQNLPCPDALPQAQAHHQLLLRISAAAVLHHLFPGVGCVDKSCKVTRKVKPPAIQKGMCRRSRSQIFLTPPVFQVVAAFPPGKGKIGNLILQKSMLLHQFDRVQIQLRTLVLVGTKPLDLIFGKCRSRLYLHQNKRSQRKKMLLLQQPKKVLFSYLLICFKRLIK